MQQKQNSPAKSTDLTHFRWWCVQNGRKNGFTKFAIYGQFVLVYQQHFESCRTESLQVQICSWISRIRTSLAFATAVAFVCLIVIGGNCVDGNRCQPTALNPRLQLIPMEKKPAVSSQRSEQQSIALQKELHQKSYHLIVEALKLDEQCKGTFTGSAI